jgi:serine protease AprX
MRSNLRPLAFGTVLVFAGLILFSTPHLNAVPNPPGWLRLIGVQSLWSQGLRGEGQVLGVLDTGFNLGARSPGHPDFLDFLSGEARGLGSTDWADSAGHGTHIAGLAVGTGAQSGGRFSGVAPGSGLVVTSIWSRLTNGLTRFSDLGPLLENLRQRGAHVITLAWGYSESPGEYDRIAASLDQWTHAYPEVLVIVAAGNLGVDANSDGVVDAGSITSPATAKNALTVGATENEDLQGGEQRALANIPSLVGRFPAEPLRSSLLSDNAGGMAAVSSRGPTRDGRIKPEIVAPGTNLIAPKSQDPRASQLWGAFDENYVYAGGTSQAAGVVAGAALLARQNWLARHPQTIPHAATLKALLLHSAAPLGPGQYGSEAQREIPAAFPNSVAGFGRLDLARLSQTRWILEEQVSAGLANGENWWSHPIRVPDAESINADSATFTLVWTDPAGTPGMAPNLKHNLSLEIWLASASPGGPFRPVRLLAAGTSFDNNFRHLRLRLADIPERPQHLLIKVTGSQISEDQNQPFSVVGSVTFR